MHIRMIQFQNVLPSVVTQADRGGLSGVIADTDHNPLKDATVSVMGEGKAARTDFTGNFFIPLKAGQYMVRIEREGHVRQMMGVMIPIQGLLMGAFIAVADFAFRAAFGALRAEDRRAIDRALARGNEPDRARFEPEERPGSRYVDFLVPGLVGLNLLGHAPKRLHDELTADYRDMIYADTAAEIEKRRKAFLRKWKLKCRAVADSLEEAGDRLFSFTRLDPSQWKSARTTNAIERLNEEFRRRIKTQTVLPCAETVPMLLWALLASGQIQMRKVDGWETLSQPLGPMALDLAA